MVQFVLNWTICNETVFDTETELFNMGLYGHLTVCKQNQYLY